MKNRFDASTAPTVGETHEFLGSLGFCVKRKRKNAVSQ